MSKIYMVTRTTWSDNDMQYDSESGTTSQEDVVGVFTEEHLANACKQMVDSWAREMRGTSEYACGTYEDGTDRFETVGWWWSCSECTIKTYEPNVLLVTAPEQQHVDEAAKIREAREAEEKAYRTKQEEESALHTFFNDHGADRHLMFLCLYLVRAGAKTLEDVTNLGVEEFISKQRYEQFVSKTEMKNGLRDFQAAILRKDFKMSANHARHRQPGGWAMGPVAGYEYKEQEDLLPW